ncbi:MAG TPA: hypothetical protein VLT47_14200, partial [Anaeromyxobacteraceae bacterium]|nr:hypothetical protein [Anaeromyxobacteraceae bacterium]
LPFATEQIGAWARSLMGAGITGRELESAVKAVAAATAIMGEQGRAAAEDLVKRLAAGGKAAADLAKSIAEGGGRANRMLTMMGVTAADVAKQLGKTPEQMARARISAVDMGHAIEKALQTKGAGPLEQMGQTFPAIFSHLKEGALSLFQDLGPAVQPFMRAVQDLFGQFGRGTSAMGGLRGVVTEVFGTIFKYATKAVQAVSDFVRANFTAANVGSTWASVKSAIATVVGYLGKAWEAIKPLVTSSFFITGLKTAFGALAIVLGVIVAALAATTIAMGAVWAAISTLGVILWGVIGKVIGFVGGALSALGNLASGALAAARDFVMGLVQGIENGAAEVVAAVSGLASKALGAFRGVFQIHSPSAVMREHGDEDIAGAAAMGVEEGAPKVERAMAKLGPTVGPAARGSASGKAGSASASGGRSISLSFSGCTFGAGLTQSMVDEMFRAAAEKFFGEEWASGPEPEPA